MSRLLNKNFLRFEKKIHPAAQIVDFYKMIFQGRFGAAHFIFDPQQTKKFLEQELENAETFEDHYFQQISEDFFRVNLRLIKEKIIASDNLLQAFMNSTKPIPKIDAWITDWKEISQSLLIEFGWIKKDLLDFNETLSEDNYIFHHSQIYHATYHPHYRLISEKELIKILKI